MAIPILILLFFIAANIAALAALLYNKRRSRTDYRRSLAIRRALSDAVFLGKTVDLGPLIKRHPRISLRLWRDLGGALALSPEEAEPVREAFFQAGLQKRLLGALRSPFPGSRYTAARSLKPLVSQDTLPNLCAALVGEKYEYIKLALTLDVLSSGQDEAFDAVAAALSSSSISFFRSVQGMLSLAPAAFVPWAERRSGMEDPGTKLVILSGARSYPEPWLKDYVAAHLAHDDPRVQSCAIATAEELYPEILADLAFAPDADIVSRRASVRSFVKISFPLNLHSLAVFFEDPLVKDVAVASLAEYISRYPEEAERVLEFLHCLDDPVERSAFSQALAGRLPFLLISSADPERCRPVAEDCIELGLNAGLIALLNTRWDPSIQKLLLDWVRPFTVSNPHFRSDCARFLNEELRTELEIAPSEVPKSSRKIPLTKLDRAALTGLLAAVLILPAALISAELSTATIGKIGILVREYVKLFTFGFGFYAAALNCLYLVLILLAGRNLRGQGRYWSLLDKEYLFAPGVLPSISILAPAYNEEKTVVQSVHSLLTLEYPDYQVIVINDGSKDDTIGVLVREFDLERIDPPLHGTIPTAPIRGVYRSRYNRRLLVIDKENGGKADALNTGINLSDREYICSIDSDSLIEPDALLRMAAQVITTDAEIIAVGGNILPVNGCTVERGMLQQISLSGNRIARFQTIEYLRSFIAGRLGWAQLNGLLIISGAFGLFRRSRVMEIGGYMTGRGEFQRDTVGEDMELVVRLVRRMRDTGRKYGIRYAATANCWTEVPEDIRSLYKQRDRWHRGLVEIITWHRRMIGNPRYGIAGLISLPYFVIFELIGPFYEFAGYPLMVLGFVTGALHPQVFIIMFSAVLLFGLLISMISLVLSERDIVYFKPRELRILIMHSVMENFGFRQLMGWVRVFAFVGMLVKNKGWQKLERKGFTVRAA